MAKYNESFKREVVEHFHKYGFSSTLKVYNISSTALNKWRKNYERGTFMRKPSKNYTVKEKLEIIDHYKKYGMKEAVDKYEISHSVIYSWERILVEEGEQALGIERRGNPGNHRIKHDVSNNEDLLKEVQRLRLENAYLKKLQALDQEKQKKK